MSDAGDMGGECDGVVGSGGSKRDAVVDEDEGVGGDSSRNDHDEEVEADELTTKDVGAWYCNLV